MKRYADCPLILRDFLTYHENIKAQSPNTIHEYYLDLRMFLRFMKLMKSGMSGDLLLPCIVGFATSALFGYLAIFTVKLLVKKNSFQWFGVYCLAVGLLTILLNVI